MSGSTSYYGKPIGLRTYVRRGKSMKAAEDADALAEEDPSGG